jgi:hypothetical protein
MARVGTPAFKLEELAFCEQAPLRDIKLQREEQSPRSGTRETTVGQQT